MSAPTLAINVNAQQSGLVALNEQLSALRANAAGLSSASLQSPLATLQRQMASDVAKIRASASETSKQLEDLNNSLAGKRTISAVPKQIKDIGDASANSSPKLKGLTLDMHDAHAAARGLAGGFGQLWLTYGNTLPLVAGAALSGSFVQIVKLGAQVQNTFAAIQVLSEETSSSVAGLNTQMLTLARTGPFGPLEIAEAMKTLSLAGLSAKEVSQSIGDVLRFSVAGDTSIKTSADTLSTVSTAFRLGADNYGYVSDVVAKAAAISKSSVESISNAFKTASVINNQFGASLEDVGLGLSVLANVGIQGTAAGTSLRNFYVDILGRSPKVVKELKSLAESIGVQSIAMDQATGKALPFIEVMSNLNKALSTKTPEARSQSIKNVFSDRGEKSFFAAQAALESSAKESGKTVDTLLTEMKFKLDNAAGFVAISAAQMALTPLNQLKSVKSALEATFVETFASLQPQVLSFSTQMKEAFGSEEFRNGITRLATTLANLAVAFTSNLNIILPLAAGLGLLKVALAVEALFVGLAVRSTAAAVGMAEFAASTTVAKVATQTLTPALLEASLAKKGLEVSALSTAGAMGQAAAKGVGLASGLAAVLGVVSKLALPLTLLYGAWELYSFWSGKASDTTTNSLTGREALLKSLQGELTRLKDVNEAKALGISLDEFQSKKSQSKARLAGEDDFSVKKKALESARDNLAKEQNVKFGQGGVAARANLLQGLQQEVVKADKAFDAVINKINLTEDGIRTAKKDIFSITNIKADAAKLTVKNNTLPKESGTVGLAETAKSAKSSAASGTIEVEELNRINAFYRAKEDSLKLSLNSEAKLLKLKYDAGAESEGNYLAELSRINEEQGRKTLELATQRFNEGELAIATARVVSQQKYGESSKQMADVLTKEATLREANKSQLDKETEAVNRLVKEREQLAFWESAKVINKANTSAKEYLEKERIELEKINALLQARQDLAGGNPAELAAFEARNTSLAKHETYLISLKKAYEDAAKTADDLAAKGSPDAAAYGRQRDAAKNNYDTAKSTLTRDADVAGQQALETAYANSAKALKGSMVDAIVTGMTEGSEKGSEAARKLIEEAFLRKPLKMFIEGFAEGGFDRGVSALGGSALGDIFGIGRKAKGKPSGTGGGVKDFDPTAQSVEDYLQTFSSGLGTSLDTSSQGLQNLFQGFDGGLGETFSTAASMLSDMFSGQGSGSTGGGGWVSLIASLFAKGDQFGAGITPFASGASFQTNSVLSSPTLFKFAKGLGVAGEAGPEAVMPLARDSQGRLGVRGGSGGGGGASINYAPTIHIDSRTDRAEVYQSVQESLQQNNKALMDHLAETGVVAR